jgi:ABC-type multidrug transport system fused ATPase/permease subunit
MHQKKFGFEHARMSPEELAIESLPKPPDADNGKGTTLFPQGSTLSLKLYENPDYFNYNKQNCPMDNLTDYFCDNFYNCVAAPEPAPTEDSPSVLDMFGFLVSLCVIYMSAAAYWAQVFPGQNGAPQKFYFFLLPRYWLGDRAKESSQEKREQGVVISEVRKQYDDFEAVKGVSMRMESGSVTALLGHNGAGKSVDVTCFWTRIESSNQ